MQVNTIGPVRPKLSLPFTPAAAAGQKPTRRTERRSPTLSRHELRRLVAGIIG
jgi:hypothetical protein